MSVIKLTQGRDEGERPDSSPAASVLKNRQRAAQEIVDAVLAEVDEFSRGGAHVDDKVLMVLKVSHNGGLSTGHAQK